MWSSHRCAGPPEDPLSPITRFFEAAKPILHAEIKPTANFTGRDAALDAIGEALERGAKAAITQPAAVHGLGGIGKSTLAREFAWRAAEAGPLFRRVVAPRGEVHGQRHLGRHRAGPRRSARRALSRPRTAEGTREGRARHAALSLHRAASKSPGFSSTTMSTTRRCWTPGRRPPNVQVLMTSRLGGWGAEVAPVEVEEWALDEAIRYLRDASGRGDLDDDR